MIGVPSLLPARELLTAQKGVDGHWHAHYPTGTKTLCGLDVGPIKRGPKMLPDCGVCSKTARAWQRIEPCFPNAWLPEPVEEVVAA